MTELAAAFDAVVGALERSGLDYVVVGSTAAAGWGVARTTRDVDVVLQLDHDAADGFLESLDRSRLARRVSADVLGLASWVATAEDVILSKLRWRLDSRSEVQWRDRPNRSPSGCRSCRSGTERGQRSGVVVCFSIRQPSTRSSSAVSSTASP